jgi:hypothetical protein
MERDAISIDDDYMSLACNIEIDWSGYTMTENTQEYRGSIQFRTCDTQFAGE